MSESAPDQPPRTRHGKAKRHHYVPEMILRRFAGPDLHLWSFDKRHPGYGIERKPIARLFREWDLYTSVDAAGGRDRSAETRLSVMESRASPVLDRIVAEARQGRLATVSNADREALADILVAQIRRSPDAFNSITAKWDFDAFIADRLAEWEATGRSVEDADRADLLSGRFVAQTRRNLLAQTVVEPLLRVSAGVLRRGFIVGMLTKPNRSFLVGSALLARFNGRITQRNGFLDPTMEAWMPIARDVAICSYGERGNERIMEVEDAGLRKINGLLSRQSTVVASASRELVVAYTRRLHRAPLEGAVSPSA